MDLGLTVPHSSRWHLTVFGSSMVGVEVSASKSASTVNRNDSSGTSQYHQSRSGWFATIIKVQSEWRLAHQESMDVQRCRKMTCYNRPDIGNRIYLSEYHNSAFAAGLPVRL